MKKLSPRLHTRGLRVALFSSLLTLVALPLSAQTANINVGLRDVAMNGMDPDANGETNMSWNFDDTSIVTYKDWQYCAYWDNGTVVNNVRKYHVSVARRQLKPTLGNWVSISLTDYDRNQDTDAPSSSGANFGDDHEKVAIGISPDGYIHLAFDHHVDYLHYRVSNNPIGNNPGTSGWSANLFSAVRRSLNPGGSTVTKVTYPRFYADYDNNRFILYMRSDGSGNGDAHLFNYSTTTNSWNVSSLDTSRFIDNKTTAYSDGTVNPYPAGLDLRNQAIHLIWTWRGTTAPTTCFDIAHAFSTDLGATWKGGRNGALIGTRGSPNGSSDLINADDPSVTAVDIGLGKIINANFTMTIDANKNIYVYYRDYSDNKKYYRKRTASNGANGGGTWSAAIPAPDVNSPNLVTAPGPNGSVFLVSKGGVYQLLNNGSFWLARVPPASAPAYGPADIAVDLQRLKAEGVISVIGQDAGTRVFTVDYSNLPAPQ